MMPRVNSQTADESKFENFVTSRKLVVFWGKTGKNLDTRTRKLARVLAPAISDEIVSFDKIDSYYRPVVYKKTRI